MSYEFLHNANSQMQSEYVPPLVELQAEQDPHQNRQARRVSQPAESTTEELRNHSSLPFPECI